MLSQMTEEELAQATGGLMPRGVGQALARFSEGYKFDLGVNLHKLEMGPIGSRFAAFFGGIDQMKNPDYIKNGMTRYFKDNPPPFNPKSLTQRLREHFAK